MHHCDPQFRLLAETVDCPELAEPATIAYGLWADLTLAGYNRAYVEFAEQNGGQEMIARFELGSYLPSAVSRPLRRFMQSALTRCLDECCVWRQRLENSSADQYRLTQMSVYPLARSEGLLVTVAPVLAHPHDRGVCNADDAVYLDVNALLHQCSYCRRTQQARRPAAWDWIPQWVAAAPKNTSFVICPECFDQYVSEPADDRALTQSTVPSGRLVGV